MNQPSPFRTADEKAREREAKRDAVLYAAVRMFNERGFYQTSLDDVAASLGISKRTIYHYLSNKDQVLLECLTIGLKQLLDAARLVRNGSGNGKEKLARFLELYAQITMKDFGRCVIRTGPHVLSAESAPRYVALKREIDTALREMIEAAIADRSIAPVDVKIAAFALAGALNWPANWFSADGPRSAQQVAGDLVELLMTGLEPRS